jgi:hypothetical protein
VSSEPLFEARSGRFDPNGGLADLSRQALAHLGREYLLLGHLVDRVGIPLAIQRLGRDAQLALSIEEWMGASPIYSKRMQRALGFEGTDVATVFKNLQLDIGAPPQFMDFQFRLDGPESGEFWLPHCGALLDIEPFGEKQVRLMCHDIEDPTFDATAAATHPRMRMRPIHRPPRVPAQRYPHCRWRVFLDPDAEPNEPLAELAGHRATQLAGIPLALPESDLEPGGWPDYSGPFDPGFQLEDLSHRALLIVCQEAAVQTHLLVRAYLYGIERRADVASARALGRRQWTGSAALGAQRLHRLIGTNDTGIDAIARVFQLHPHFQPRTYVDFRVEKTGPSEARLSIGECPALEEGDARSWFADLGPEPHPALDAIAGAVNPRARCFPADELRGARFAWDVRIDEAAEPRAEPPELALARLSRGADFELMQRRPLRR